MPYKISDNGLCVHKLNANGSMGDVVKCHKTPDEAAAHMRALYANVEDAATKETGPASDYLIVEDAEQPSTYHLRVKVDGKPDHTLMGAAWAALHSGYRGNVYEGPGKQEAIAKLKRLYGEEKMPIPSEKGILFIADDAELSDEELQAVEQVYRDIEAGKVKLESLAEPDAVTDKAQTFPRPGGGSPGPAGNPSGTPGGSQGSHDSKIERCYLRVKKLGGDETTARKICRSMFGGRPGIKQAKGEASFAVYKQADGAYRWLAVTSSSFQDRDKEIVSQRALEADAERMNATGDFGALDWWHTPIILGTCDFSAMHGRLSVESGTFRDAWIAAKFAEAKDGFEMSRAFYHPITEPDPEGVYHNIKTFSRAVIPQGKGKASNLLTTFAVVEKEKQMLTDKIKELKAMFGGNKEASDKVDALLAEAEQKEQAATVAGIAAKETKPEAAPETAKPEPEKAKEAPILEQPGMFIADMKPEEFSALMTKAMGDSQMATMAQMAEMMAQMQTMMKAMLGEAAMEQAKEIAALATKQAALETQVKELNGLTPRGYRATQDPATATNKDAKPGADEKANYFSQFVNGFVLGQPQPPVK